MNEDEQYLDEQSDLAGAEAAAIGGDPGEPDYDDPAQRPVREAGGGEAEGFEEAEQALIDHAEHGDLGRHPELDAMTPERESDLSGAEYGDPDRVSSSEREEDQEDRAQS